MNERIRELIKKADEYADSLDLSGAEWCDTQNSKFVELVVKECADMVASSSLPDAYSEPYLSVIAEEMKEHFGVEDK